MKITNGQQHYLNAIKHNRKASVETTRQPVVAQKQNESVSVEISDEAKKLSQASLSAAPSEKAAAIKQAIQAGTYQVSPEKITQGLLDEMAAQKKADH